MLFYLGTQLLEYFVPLFGKVVPLLLCLVSIPDQLLQRGRLLRVGAEHLAVPPSGCRAACDAQSLVSRVRRVWRRDDGGLGLGFGGCGGGTMEG